MGAGLTRICTISVSPATTPSMVHFVGQQNSYASNANAICQQGGVTNTFTGTMQGVNNGTNTSMFPIYLRAQRNPTASAPSPACVFVFKTSAYSETALCTISVADGLPVELMDFGIEEEDGAAAHGTETTAREGSEDSK